MDEWLAQLELDIEYQQQSGITMEQPFFDEQLTAALGEDFPNSFFTDGGDSSSSPQLDFDYNIIQQFASTQPPSNNSNNNNNKHDNNNNNGNNDSDGNNNDSNDVDSNDNSNNADDGNNCNYNIVSSKVEGKSQQLQNKEKTTSNKKQVTASGGAKRKRQPSQVQDHIIAERKRRELLSQLFISLSSIVPGLKKIDKTSVLGATIKYMKQLQERVKVLEEVAAKRLVESIVVIKKSRQIVDDNDGGGDDNSCSSTVGCHSPSGGGGGGGEADYLNNSLPEIEVKLSGKNLLLRIHYEEQKEILPTVLDELIKHGMSVTNCSVIPFNNSAIDICIVAQIMMERGEFSVKEFIRSLRSALRLGSHHQCHASGADYHSS